MYCLYLAVLLLLHADTLMSSHNVNPTEQVTEPLDAQRDHSLTLAREIMKQLTSRTLVVIVPMLLATIAISTALRPHLKGIEHIVGTLKIQTKAFGSEKSSTLDELRLEGFDPSKLPKSKETDNAILRDRAESLSDALKKSREEIEETRDRALATLSLAVVEIPIPGSSNVKVKLIHAALTLQAIILAVLLHLRALRQMLLSRLSYVAENPGMHGLSRYQALAGPLSPMALPLNDARIIALVTYEKDTKRGQYFQLIGALLFFSTTSLWLLYLNSHIMDLMSERSFEGHVWFVLSLMLAITTCCIAFAWFVDVPSLEELDHTHSRSRRCAILLITGGLGIAIAVATKPRIARSTFQVTKQSVYRLLSLHPRPYKKRSSEWLTTSKIRDGFLFNARSQKSHMVIAGRIISVKRTTRNESSFVCFSRRSIDEVSNVAQGLTTIAIERTVLEMLDSDPKMAMDQLKNWIIGRLPLVAPSKANYLDLRLFDLYAKLCVVYYYEDRLKDFVTILRKSSVAYLLSDRLERWSDSKNKWRKRVLDYGRCSSVGYPVAGRCGFESRPATFVRSHKQWFAPTTSPESLH